MKQNILIRPVITEKTLKLAEEANQYTFLVDPSVNKHEINDAVTSMFNVAVEKVQVTRLRGKRVQFGRMRTQGSRSVRKKAVVTLKPGDKIDLFELK